MEKSLTEATANRNPQRQKELAAYRVCYALQNYVDGGTFRAREWQRVSEHLRNFQAADAAQKESSK